MQKEVIWLGPAPAEEECGQVGDPDYPERSRAECRAYIQAIKRVCGEPPEGAILTVKSQPHDFGSYREVALVFDADSREAAEYASKCDEHAPTTWEEAGMAAPVIRRHGR